MQKCVVEDGETMRRRRRRSRKEGVCLYGDPPPPPLLSFTLHNQLTETLAATGQAAESSTRPAHTSCNVSTWDQNPAASLQDIKGGLLLWYSQ